MVKPALKLTHTTTEVISGVFSKKSAVDAIGNGCRHLHSSTLAERDPATKSTQEALSNSTVPTYPWESGNKIEELRLASSVDRQSLIHQVITRAGIEKKRYLREKAESVLEELLTNALFHAYRNPDGKEKYSRRSQVTLKSSEVITLRFQLSANGLFLSVEDLAGSLDFNEVAQALSRCYGPGAQIENKEGGAGLGTYMVFDAVTHLKIVTSKGKKTTVSCWIADQKSHKQELFSFNFFERR